MNMLLSMQVFCQVIDCQGFSAAARALDMSPPVVTRLIADLEKHLSARLLNRSTSRKLALTEAGELYLKQVREILANIEEAEASVQTATQTLKGRLKVLASPSLATFQMVEVIHKFKKKYPKVVIDLATSSQTEMLDDDFDVCVALTHDRPLNGDFIARRLAQTHLLLCGSREYLERNGHPQNPTDLIDHSLVSMPFMRDLKFTRVSSNGTANSLEISGFMNHKNIAVCTTQLEFARLAALRGLGLVVLPSFAAALSCSSGELQRVLKNWSLPALKIHAAIPTREHVPIKTKAFLDHLVETYPDSLQDPWIGSC